MVRDVDPPRFNNRINKSIDGCLLLIKNYCCQKSVRAGSWDLPGGSSEALRKLGRSSATGLHYK